MKNIFKGLGIGFMALALVAVVGVGQADAVLTLDALTATSSGALTVNSAAASNTILAGASTSGTITLGAALTTGTLTLGKTDQTGITVISGSTNGANTILDNVTTGSISIGTVATGAINIGTGSAVHAITIGSTNTTGTVTINSGTTLTGRVIMVGSGQLSFDAAAGTVAKTGGSGTVAIVATSTDAAGQISATSDVANTAIILTFAKTYTAAPVCVISGANAGGANAIGSATGVIVTSDATTMTLTYGGIAEAKAFNYHCFSAI